MEVFTNSVIQDYIGESVPPDVVPEDVDCSGKMFYLFAYLNIQGHTKKKFHFYNPVNFFNIHGR